MIQQSPTERARAINVLASVTARMAPAGEYVARDIRAGNLTSENERAIAAMIEFASQAAQPAEADGVERPALPAEAVHAADCDHPRAQIWMCKCPRPVFAATPTAPATDAGEVVAYLHTLHMEGGQTYTRLLEEDGTDEGYPDRTAFGIPGRDYSAEYRVTTTPLYATPPVPNDDLRAALERIELLASNHGGWADADARKCVADIGLIATAALKENHRG